MGKKGYHLKCSWVRSKKPRRSSKIRHPSSKRKIKRKRMSKKVSKRRHISGGGGHTQSKRKHTPSKRKHTPSKRKHVSSKRKEKIGLCGPYSSFKKNVPKSPSGSGSVKKFKKNVPKSPSGSVKKFKKTPHKTLHKTLHKTSSNTSSSSKTSNSTIINIKPTRSSSKRSSPKRSSPKVSKHTNKKQSYDRRSNKKQSYDGRSYKKQEYKNQKLGADVTIYNKNGGFKVLPWLAAAALLATGLWFRKDISNALGSSVSNTSNTSSNVTNTSSSISSYNGLNEAVPKTINLTSGCDEFRVETLCLRNVGLVPTDTKVNIKEEEGKKKTKEEE